MTLITNAYWEAIKTAFCCPACGEYFGLPDKPVEVWHCQVCDHHWQMHVETCRNCHEGRRP